MAVCRMDAALWKIISGVQGPGALESAKVPCSVKLPRNVPQRVHANALTLKKVGNLGLWNVGYQIPSQLQSRCNATPEGPDGNSKSYDISEVVEKVVESEKGKIPESDKEASPDELPEGEPSPFSPAIDLDTDDTSHANQGEGVTKESLVQPSRDSLEDTQGEGAQDVLRAWTGNVEDNAIQEAAGKTSGNQVSGAASSSLGEIDGSEEQFLESAKAPINETQQTALHSGQGGLQGGSSSSTGRDWRVYSSGNGGQIGEKGEGVALQHSDVSSQQGGVHRHSFGWIESSCDEGSIVALAGILQEDGGKSIADYRTRADIFGKSAEFFAAQKREVRV